MKIGRVPLRMVPGTADCVSLVFLPSSLRRDLWPRTRVALCRGKGSDEESGDAGQRLWAHTGSGDLKLPRGPPVRVGAAESRDKWPSSSHPGHRRPADPSGPFPHSGLHNGAGVLHSQQNPHVGP